jgi:hemerythrin
MALMEWRDEFRLGIASVDHEHQQLFALINAAHAAMGERGSPAPRGERGSPGAVGDFLGEIHAAIAAHFALEEKIMRERAYDQYAAHKADHERLLDDIRAMMDENEAGYFSGGEAILAARLKEWFSRHFREMDARLHRLLGADWHGA